MPLNLCPQIFYSHGKTSSPNLKGSSTSTLGQQRGHDHSPSPNLYKPSQTHTSYTFCANFNPLWQPFHFKDTTTKLPSLQISIRFKTSEIGLIEPTNIYIYIYIYMFSLVLIWCHKLPLSQSLRTNLRSISKINWKQGSMHCHVQHAPSVCLLYYGHVFTNLVSCASIHPSWFVRPVASTVPCVKFEVSHVSPTNVSSDVNIVPR